LPTFQAFGKLQNSLMNTLTPPLFLRSLISVTAVAMTLGTARATGGITPSVSGKYPVACSNVEQDFTRVKAGASAADYWEGTPLSDGSHYVTELLVSPPNALTYSVKVPKVSELDVFEKQGGKLLPYAAIACYPTTTGNTRADYVLPSGIKVPKMKRR
jgi:hypothetical protein